MKKGIMKILLCLWMSFLFSYVPVYASSMEDVDGCFSENENGFDTWLSGKNPYVREMYGGYERDGYFLLFNEDNKEVYEATHISCYWKSNGVGQRYLLDNNQWIEKTNKIQTREYIKTNGDFILLKDCTVYTHPFFEEECRTREVLKAGTYTSLKISMDYVQLQKEDGTAVWVLPQYTDEDVFLNTCQGYFEESLDVLSVNEVNGIPIKQMMMSIRADKRTGIAMQPQYVTIHNTGNEGMGANAYKHAYNQIYDSRTNISWHYTVDNIEIYQSMPMNEIGFHAGDGLNIGNGATIGIEICENKDGNYAQAEMNAAYLTAQILFENNLPSDAVRMHHDWSGKNCAQNILEGTEGTMGWQAFKALVKTEYDRLVREQMETPPTEGVTYLKGDVNGDGYISSKDYNAIKNHIVGSKCLIEDVLLRADVNQDGYISSKDYNAIKNHIVGTKKLF